MRTVQQRVAGTKLANLVKQQIAMNIDLSWSREQVDT
jgi:hypothetical protein